MSSQGWLRKRRTLGGWSGRKPDHEAQVLFAAVYKNVRSSRGARFSEVRELFALQTVCGEKDLNGSAAEP